MFVNLATIKYIIKENGVKMVHISGMDYINGYAEENGFLTGYKGQVMLQLGCGNCYLPDHINIDIRNSGKTRPDKVMDLLDLDKCFRKDSVSVIQLHHVIEHFSYREGEFLLLQIYKVLKKGGLLVLSCPDILYSMR